MELHSRKPLPKASDIQLIVCDVDGTLLDSQHRLSPTSPTHTILRRIRSTYRDLPIVISTGKTYHATAELRLQLDLSPFPASHHNGNLIYAASGEIIHESVVSPVVVDEVYAACRAIGASLFITDRDRAYHVLPVKTFTDEQVARLKRGLGEEVVELARAEESMRRVRTGDLKVFSMAVVEAPSYLASVRTRLDALGPMHVSITLAMPFCLYLLPPSNDKGTALLHIIAHLNATRAPATRTIDTGGVLTFGDGDNDVPMFEVAGMSVAMGNGMEAAKAKAGWVTGTHDEGGVGMFLREVFFHDDGGLCSK